MRTYSLLIFILSFICWNIGIVLFSLYTIRKEMYKPKLFSFLFSFGFGLLICLPLPILQIVNSNLKPSVIWYSILVFIIIFLFCYPSAYFIYKNILMKYKIKLIKKIGHDE
jgi:hypothetical protein